MPGAVARAAAGRPVRGEQPARVIGLKQSVEEVKKLAPHSLAILSVADSVYMENGMLKSKPYNPAESMR